MYYAFWFSQERWYHKSVFPSMGAGWLELKIDEKVKKILFVWSYLGYSLSLESDNHAYKVTKYMYIIFVTEKSK